MPIEKEKERVSCPGSKRRRWLPLILLSLLAAAAVWLWWGNCTIQISRLHIADNRLPNAFDGFTVVQVSDLHNASFDGGQEKLLQLIRNENPDIIAITGDLIDATHTDLNAAVTFVKGAVEIAGASGVYCVTGNHEAWLPSYADLEEQLRQAGATLLRDEAVLLQREGQSIRLAGLDDPAFFSEGNLLGERAAAVESRLRKLMEGEPCYTLLLSHRPELMDSYRACGVELVLSGHAHGGQIRLPLLGGVVAPDQGLFPAYSSGIYREGDTCMVVSRGLGNSILPIRVNNRPELVVITLDSHPDSGG